jgi:hypothetical protein
MPKTWDKAASVENVAEGLIPNYHGELRSARILYSFVSEASRSSGVLIPGKSNKIPASQSWYTDYDFVVEVALDVWNDMAPSQRTALVDHLLSWCTGEQDESTGEMIWKRKQPDVHEFSDVLHRHGAWNEALQSFVSVAKAIQVSEIVDEESAVGLATGEVEIAVGEVEVEGAGADHEADLEALNSMMAEV